MTSTTCQKKIIIYLPAPSLAGRIYASAQASHQAARRKSGSVFRLYHLREGISKPLKQLYKLQEVRAEVIRQLHHLQRRHEEAIFHHYKLQGGLTD
ncbi:MAG: hypothetical protein N4A71_27525 [Carboxylicivirga sp.]|nr:hypothetical protein [Carboxylicivirga sp.]